ncbi:MAG: right-handed parallel beta-helix repeat-containing protein, partial [Geminicoccaceae bacterium]
PRAPSAAASPTAVPAELIPAATLTVTTAADLVDPKDGKLSLREAVARAEASPAADAIDFAATLKGKTLVLTGGELVLTSSMTINGAKADVTLSGGDANRVFNIAGGVDVRLSHLTLTRGHSPAHESGGAILLGGSSRLTILDSTVEANNGESRGGGVAVGSNSELIIRRSLFRHNIGNVSDDHGGGGGALYLQHSTLDIEDSVLSQNGHIIRDEDFYFSQGGAIYIRYGSAKIFRCTISNNEEHLGGGISADQTAVTIVDSTIVGNLAYTSYYGSNGGGLRVFGGKIDIRNTVVTGNRAGGGYDRYGSTGGGIIASSLLHVDSSIVAGNAVYSSDGYAELPDVDGTITASNGHNLFGSKVKGAVAGDRQNVAPATIFAAIDPTTGGGKLSPSGIVPLKNAITNPALTAADPITASSFGQLGTTPRPLPAGSLPDIGSIEIKQSLSTSPTVNNDVLTGSGGANNLAGLAGNDLIQGLAGADTLNGQDGSDVLDGGPGNDVLNGGPGMDIATFAGTTAVVVDLAAKPATARRGSETDTLTSIEGIIGSSKADTFKGDGQNNEFQGGLGKDTTTGGAGRDLYAFRSVQDSPARTGRDVVKDFAPGQDVIDVSNIDADSTTPGQQSFRWVGKATLTGAAQLGYFVSGGNTIVRASTDADAQPELEIQLTGSKTMTAADFRF